MSTRNDVIDALREMRATLDGLLPADFLQENDRAELAQARQLLYNVVNRLLGDNYNESSRFPRLAHPRCPSVAPLPRGIVMSGSHQVHEPDPCNMDCISLRASPLTCELPAG